MGLKAPEEGSIAPVTSWGSAVVPLGIGVVLLVLMVWPWPMAPLGVLGSPVMESDSHMWMMWRGTQGWWGGAEVVANWPEGDLRPLMDWNHLPLVFLLSPLGMGFAYSACFVFDCGLALLGGYWLSREFGASREGALVGMAVLGTCPFLSGALTFGLSEAWSLGWLALHGALLLRMGRTESVWAGLGAGACLGAYALSGWYQAVFGCIGGLGWLLILWRLHGLSNPVKRIWLAQGCLAAVMVCPALVLFLQDGDVAGLMARPTPDWIWRPDWRHGAPMGTDALNVFLPTMGSIELTRSVYLGLVAVTLAGVGAWFKPALRWALAIGLIFWALALGHHPTIAGNALGWGSPIPGPAAWLAAWVPPLRAISGWYRAAGVLVVFVAPLAALGASKVAARWRYASWGLLVLVVCDGLLLSDAPWPRLGYDPRPPASVMAVPGQGPMVLLPLDRGDSEWPGRASRMYHRWQPWMNRPVSEHYEGPEAVLADPVIAWADYLCHGSTRATVHPPAVPVTEPPSLAALEPPKQSLLAMGFEVLVVVRPRAKAPTRCVRYLKDTLGPPSGEDDVLSWWILGD